MSSTRSTTARRAIVRWSWRLFKREWRAQLIVLCLATVAVGAAIVGSSMAVRAGTDDAGLFGNADAVIQLSSDDPARATAAAQALVAGDDDAEVVDHQRWTVPGSTATVDVRALDPTGHLVAPMIGLREGRYPTSAAEVALTPQASTLLDARLGDSVTLAGADRTVVGIVENPARLSDEFALVTPGSIAAPTVVDVLVAHFSGLRGVQTDQVDVGVMQHSNDDGGRLVLVAVVIAVAMTLVGLVAAAGFLVVAQRRQRQLGLLAAIGATRQHLRMVMLANGAIVGAVAAVLGTALGVVGWNLVLPVVRSSADRHLGRLDLRVVSSRRDRGAVGGHVHPGGVVAGPDGVARPGDVGAVGPTTTTSPGATARCSSPSRSWPPARGRSLRPEPHDRIRSRCCSSSACSPSCSA